MFNKLQLTLIAPVLLSSSTPTDSRFNLLVLAALPVTNEKRIILGPHKGKDLTKLEKINVHYVQEHMTFMLNTL